MGQKKDIENTKKAEILSLLNHSSLSQRDIAKKTMVSVATVNRIKKNIVTENVPCKTGRQNCRGKRVTTPRGDRKIAEILKENRWKSRRSILNLLQASGVMISDGTLRRRMKELGFQCYKPAKKPRLTPAMLKSRLEWAKAHLHWTADDWEKVAW